MSTITVRIDSSRPIFIEADADSFGQIFAGLSDEEQVNVLRSIVEHMKPHRMQWDYIAIALEKEENRDVRDDLSVIFPAVHEALAELSKLREENEQMRAALSKIAEHTSRCQHDGGFDREIGPIGCNLGDGCLCIGLHPIARAALAGGYDA